ncbi:MAG: carbonate dehydratase [Hyphomicrobiales bacterium]|nr:MAG: carbonate dehydratase [Hyphomicrobiales bacterium]
MTISTIPTSLLNGYRRFRDISFEAERGRYEQLARLGQAPVAMVVACSDARVEPQRVFDTGPGDLFIVRNVANLVPPEEPTGEQTGDYHGTSAAIEFAVDGLLVPSIIVLGHTRCGGIRAYVEGKYREPGPGHFIGKWIGMLDRADPPLVDRLSEGCDHDHRSTEAEFEAVRISVNNLLTFECVRKAVAAGRLSVHGACFDIAEAKLHWLDIEKGEYVPVE